MLKIKQAWAAARLRTGKSHQNQEEIMAHIVVVGAGIGGMTVAYDLRGKLNKSDHSVTVIGDKPSFEFTPSNPWVAVG